MKKSNLFFLLSGITTIPLIIGATYTGIFITNYNEYNNIIEMNYLMAQISKWDSIKMQSSIEQSLNTAKLQSKWSQLEKDIQIEINQKNYQQAIAQGVQGYNLEYAKILANLTYTFPEREQYIIGLIILVTSIALFLSTFILSILLKRQEKNLSKKIIMLKKIKKRSKNI